MNSWMARRLRRDDAAVAAVLAGVGEGVPVDKAEQALVDVDHGERRGVRGEREPLVDLPGEAERLRLSRRTHSFIGCTLAGVASLRIH